MQFYYRYQQMTFNFRKALFRYGKIINLINTYYIKIYLINKKNLLKFFQNNQREIHFIEN